MTCPERDIQVMAQIILQLQMASDYRYPLHNFITHLTTIVQVHKSQAIRDNGLTQ